MDFSLYFVLTKVDTPNGIVISLTISPHVGKFNSTPNINADIINTIKINVTTNLIPYSAVDKCLPNIFGTDIPANQEIVNIAALYNQYSSFKKSFSITDSIMKTSA